MIPIYLAIMALGVFSLSLTAAIIRLSRKAKPVQLRTLMLETKPYVSDETFFKKEI